MTIEDALELLRGEYVEEAIKNLAKKSDKDLLLFWAALEEFERPKMMRGNIVAETETTDNKIELVEATGNTNLS